MSQTKRKICNTCQRPKKVCFCSHLVNLNNKTKVLIIQHPKEVGHPFNTGEIVALCLSNVELAVAEILDENLIDKIRNFNSVLLYPDRNKDTELDSDAASDGLISETNNREVEQLVVLDASWRKSKRMLFANSCLQKLPRLSLDGYEKSQYHIRRTATKGALSTIESITHALSMIEPDNNFEPLLKPFYQMIKIQKRYQASIESMK